MGSSVIIMFLIFLHFLGENSASELLPMGPYEYKINYMKDCIDPKKKSKSIFTKTEVVTKENNVQIAVGNMCFLKNVGPLKMIMRGSVFIGNRYKPMVNTQVSNVCNEKFTQNVLKKIFNLQKNCIIGKGNYTFELNVTRVTHDLVGDIFFYGKFRFETNIYTDTYPVLCVKTETEFKKKVK